MVDISVALGQMDTVWRSPKENLSKLETICENISGKAQLLVLPEMWNTGFCTNVDFIDKDWYQFTLDAMKDFSTKFQIAIVGSMPAFDNGFWYNRMVCVYGGSLVHVYDKIHLFQLAGESQNFTAGESNIVFTLFGISVRILVCYDLRFPYLTCNAETPEIIIYCANWPSVRIAQWATLIRARAVENQAFVIGVNRVGQDGSGYNYNGCSQAVSFAGQNLVTLDDKEATVLVDLNMSSLLEYRAKFPFLLDRKF
ncbi:MAG: nitrilase-related carbon-nitrogen hydrolase [Saprospiraceae bacterium]